MYKRPFIIAAILCALLGGCTGKEAGVPDWHWQEPDTPTPEEPDEPEAEKPRYVWIDASANFGDYADSRDNIARDLARIADTGFTDVVVDVRPPSGDVLFASSVAAPLTTVDAWQGSRYVWLTRTADFDYLQAFIEEGHKAGLKVHASVNTFTGGYLCPYGLGSNGMLFREPAKRVWATSINASRGIISTMNLLDDSTDWGTKFLNPAHPEVQEYLLTLLGELAAYNVDGIILDRCRYDDYGLLSDFSEVSRRQFTAYLGTEPSRWPVFDPGTESLPRVLSDTQKAWMAFRVKTIHDFVAKAADKVHSVRKDIKFGVYVGAWYSTYYESGVNWASPRYNCKREYTWATDAYQAAGYADLLDYIFLGAYAGASSIYGSSEWTMQGFATLGGQRLMGDVPYASGPDIGNTEGWVDGGQAGRIADAVKACTDASDGFFVFDLCHIKLFNYWNAFQNAFATYRDN